MRVFSLIVLLIYLGSEFFFKQGSHQLPIFLFFIWFSSIFLCKEWMVGALLSQKKYLYLLVFLIFYFISTLYGSNLYKASTSTLYMVRVFAPVLMYDILRNETYLAKCIFSFVLIVYVLWYAFNANSLISFIGYEEGLRGDNLRRGEDTYVETTFAFVYMLPVLVTTMMSVIRNTPTTRNTPTHKIRLLKLALFLSAIYLFFLSLKSLFMTAIILSVLGIIIAFLYKREEPPFKLAFKTSIVMLAFIIVFLLCFNGIQELAQKKGNKGTVERVVEIKNALTGNLSENSDLSSRNNLRSVSFKTFLSNPIFGVNHTLVGIVNEKIIGNHAQWIDDLARYGFFALFIFVFLFKAFKTQYRDTKMLLPIVLYVVIGFLNPLLYPISSINIFVLVPLLIGTMTPNNHATISILSNQNNENTYE